MKLQTQFYASGYQWSVLLLGVVFFCSPQCSAKRGGRGKDKQISYPSSLAGSSISSALFPLMTPPEQTAVDDDGLRVLPPYSPWAAWSRCSRHCTQTRKRYCVLTAKEAKELREGEQHDGDVLDGRKRGKDKKGDDLYDERCPKTKQTRLCRRGSCSVTGNLLRKNSFLRQRRKHQRKNQRKRRPTQRQREREETEEEDMDEEDSIQDGASDQHIERLIYELLYHDWTSWGPCTRSCKRRRFRECALDSWCGDSVLLEEQRCMVPGSSCQAKMRGERNKQEKDKADKKRKKPSSEEDKTSPPTAVAYDDSVCGLRDVPDKQPRIVGGYEAMPNKWPWQVAILTKWHEQYCAGVLISPNWVLTAAHCVRQKGTRRRRLLVRVAEHDLSIDEGPETDIQIQDHFLHPQFSLETIDYDIALLRLRTPVPRAPPHINFACLPEKNATKLAPGTICYAVGWGKMKATHLFGTDILREAPVPIVDKRRCGEAFEYDIMEFQLCAGYPEGGVDTCSGDSGGPLMCLVDVPGRGERWTVYGVTSFGEGCGDNGKYGIYTKVPYFHDWIERTMRENN